MKIFIHEYFACGGLLDKKLGDESLDEGIAMLRCAMADFHQTPSVEPCAIVDHRLVDKLKQMPGIVPIHANHIENFSSALANCEYVLVIAPETDGALERLAGIVESSDTTNLGASVSAIRATADKLAFAGIMREAEIAHPRTMPVETGFNPDRFFNGEYILKPVRGAGCVGVTRRAGQSKPAAGLLAQEFITGASMSLSIISGDGGPVVVSVNRQEISNGVDIKRPESERASFHPADELANRQEISNSANIKYFGGEITDVCPDDELVNLAARVSDAIPGLRGYWGIDYIQSAQGPVVIEVNPRLTTSYCALHASLGLNPAQMMLGAVRGEAVAPVGPRRKTVRFNRRGELEWQ